MRITEMNEIDHMLAEFSLGNIGEKSVCTLRENIIYTMIFTCESFTNDISFEWFTNDEDILKENLYFFSKELGVRIFMNEKSILWLKMKSFSNDSAALLKNFCEILKIRWNWTTMLLKKSHCNILKNWSNVCERFALFWKMTIIRTIRSWTNWPNFFYIIFQILNYIY